MKCLPRDLLRALSVEIVSEQRTSDRAEVHAELMRSARSRMRLHQRIALTRGEAFILRQRVHCPCLVLCANPARNNTHIGSAHIALDPPVRWVETAAQKRKIRLFDPPLPHCRVELCRCDFVLRNQHDAAGIAVKSADRSEDEGASPLCIQIHQRVRKRIVEVTVRRMRRHIRRLVYKQYVVVLVENLDRDLHGDHVSLFPIRIHQGELVPRTQDISHRHARSVDDDALLVILQPRQHFRGDPQRRAQKAAEDHSVVFFFDRYLHVTAPLSFFFYYSIANTKITSVYRKLFSKTAVCARKKRRNRFRKTAPPLITAYFTIVPVGTASSTNTTLQPHAPFVAASSIPLLVTPVIRVGFRFAITMIFFPINSSGL